MTADARVLLDRIAADVVRLRALLDQPAPAPVPVLPVDQSVRQLAAALGKSSSCIRGWVEQGKFAGAYKAGREWRIPMAAIEQFQRANRDASTEQVAGLGAWRALRAA